MLSSLQIENVAVIQKANVHFEKGLNVLTGETGAGKSILIDSINAILGNRTSKDLVRTGAAKAVIRAAFEDVPPAVLDSLEKAGYERSEALLLSREITAEGKSTCRINGMPATAAVLRELCGGLININGQHDSVGLLNPARHEGILDAYAQNSAEYQAYYAIYRELVGVLTGLGSLLPLLVATLLPWALALTWAFGAGVWRRGCGAAAAHRPLPPSCGSCAAGLSTSTVSMTPWAC